MPLPVIPAIIALSLMSAAGLGKGVGGARKMAKAKQAANRARQSHQKMVAAVQKHKNAVTNVADRYAQQIIMIKDTTFKRTVEILDKIGGGHKEKVYKTRAEIGVSRTEIKDYKQNIIYVQPLLEGGFTAYAAGAAAGPAATTSAILFGATSSSGTVISGLSGIAARNAVLAWFGRGSIAAGGGGVAVGTVMLGGITIAPAIFVTGFMLNKKGEKALTKAKMYVAGVNKSIENLKVVISFLGKMKIQIQERQSVLDQLNKRAEDIITNIDLENFDKNNDTHIKYLQGLLQFVKAISEIIQAPVLTPDGNSIDESGVKIVGKYKNLI
jgi:hypothetical protein